MIAVSTNPGDKKRTIQNVKITCSYLGFLKKKIDTFSINECSALNQNVYFIGKVSVWLFYFSDANYIFF